jgi:predicted nucleotidyltransferase
MAGISEIRTKLLEEVRTFTEKAQHIEGVLRIALIGSLTCNKTNPKDADLLVTVADDMDLGPLAKLSRKLNGHVQSHNRNAEVFLCNPGMDYIGRICYWKDCGPGIRMSCDALNYGARHYLHDDLSSVKLDRALLLKPPVVIWPEKELNDCVPVDVAYILFESVILNRKIRIQNKLGIEIKCRQKKK